MARVTEKAVCKELARACAALGIPCAYELNGDPLRPYSRAYELPAVRDMSASGYTYGAHIVDYQPQYGGVRIHSYPGGGSGGGYCRASGVFTANGLPSGMDTRITLRRAFDLLSGIAAGAEAARAEATDDDLSSVRA